MIRLKLVLILMVGWLYLNAQQVFIDQPVQAGEFILFPHIKDSTKYYYLPNKIGLGETISGKPQFSFLRYVENVRTETGGGRTEEGKGGGIVHALVQLKVDDRKLVGAERILQIKLASEEVTIAGPIIYKGGNFTLVSSFADEESDFTEQVVGAGRAPIFVGNKAAVSMRLTKLGSKILWQSCKTPTPDLSFSFVMDFIGYRSPMEAKVEVNWDKVYESDEFSAGIDINTGVVGVGVDIEAALEKLTEEGSIKVTNLGADAKMEQVLDVAYKKIVDMMFEPFSMPKKDSDTAGDIAKGFSKVARAVKQSANKVNLNFAYTMKRQRKTGHYVIDLNKIQTETINFRFDENLGSDVAGCEECFKQINLDDPLYKQREILVSIDGLNANQFSKYVNFVTVSLKKEHGNKAESFDEIRIAQNEFKEAQGNPFRLLYGWKDKADEDRTAFMQYEFETKWSFFGDHEVLETWQSSDDLGINLAPPFHPVGVSVEADPDMLKEAKIRLATVKFFYDYGAGEKQEVVTIKGNSEVPATLAEFMLKQGEYDYEYEITWRLFGNKRLSSGRQKSNDNLLYVDEIPENAIVLN